MQYIEFFPKQSVELQAKREATPAQALCAAQQFIKENNIEWAELHYNGFLFGVEHDSDIKELISEYNNYLSNKNKS